MMDSHVSWNCLYLKNNAFLPHFSIFIVNMSILNSQQNIFKNVSFCFLVEKTINVCHFQPVQVNNLLSASAAVHYSWV